jgi:peptidoglycan/LPS O-acetylase OafA/YrhL
MGTFIPALGGLRALAALAVYVQHAAFMGIAPHRIGALYVGECGVMLFFALSGFLMAQLYIRQELSILALAKFARARFARIYPLFALTIIGSGVLYHLDQTFPFEISTGEALKHLLLFGDGLTLWTISVEFQFYGIFIVLWLIYASLRIQRRNGIFALICTSLILLLWLAGFPGERIALTHYAQFFLIGTLAALASWSVPLNALRWADWALLVVLGLMGLAVLLGGFAGQGDAYSRTWLLILIGLVIFFAATSNGFISRCLGCRLLVYLGEISFGIYLLHRPMIYFWQKLGWAVPEPFDIALVTLILIGMSFFAYRFIEIPAREFITARRHGLRPQLSSRNIIAVSSSR